MWKRLLLATALVISLCGFDAVLNYRNPTILTRNTTNEWSGGGTAIDGGDPNINLSPGQETQIGDLVITCGGFTDSADGAEILTSGYTEVHDGDLTTTYAFVCGYKFQTAASENPQGEGGGNAADGVAYQSMVFRGVDTTTPMDVTAVTSFSGSAAAPTCATITPVTPGAVVVCACGASVDDTAVTPPTGYRQLTAASSGNDTEDSSVSMAFAVQNAPTATGSAAYSAWSGVYVCVHMALRPAR